GIEPKIVAKSSGFHHQRVTFPMAGGVPVPGGIRVLWKRPSVCEDLPVLHIALSQDDDPAGHRENALIVVVGPDAWCIARHSMNVRVRTLRAASLLHQFRGTGLIRRRAFPKRQDTDE